MDAIPGDERTTLAELNRRALRLAMEGQFAEAEVCSRAALRISPDDVDAINELAVAVWKQDREVEAEEICRRGCELAPDDFRLWTNLGLILMTQRRDEDAEACFRRALTIHPRVFHAHMGLGSLLSNLGAFEEAEGWLDSALRMCPDSIEAIHNAAMNLGRQNRWHEAIALFERAARIKPDWAECRRNLGYALLAVGEFRRGWVEHEWRLRCAPSPGFQINRPLWDGQEYPDRTILLHFEQGHGDTLQFIRFTPSVKRRVGRVIVLCPTALVRLLSRCEGVDMAYDGAGYEPVCQLQAPLQSVPAMLGGGLEALPTRVPYLFAEPTQVQRWRGIIDRTVGVGPLRVGIAWQGRPENGADRWRSFRLEQFATIAAIPGVRLISLQLNFGREQLDELGGRFPVIELPGRTGRDWAETAAIANNLDLVISPCSAMAHLAGGLGLPVWVALSYTGDWRWMSGRDDSPWYPTLRLFRQPRHGDWESVFARMTEELRALVSRRGGPLTGDAHAA